MPITPSISVSQSAGSPSLVGVADTSTGSDLSISVRRIYVQNSLGEYLVPSGTSTDYTVWAYADASISLNILTEDQAVSITVQWLNSSNAVLYSLTEQYCLGQYNKQFFYQLISDLGLQPGTYQDTNYSGNVSILWTNIIAADSAVTYGSDIAASQNCLNRATNMRLNEGDYF